MLKFVDNPAVMPVRNVVITQEGRQTQMEVYVSGYPLPTGNLIQWFRPNDEEIFENEPNVMFVNSRKTLVLTNIQLADFGMYRVKVSLGLGLFPFTRSTGIFLDVQG